MASSDVDLAQKVLSQTQFIDRAPSSRANDQWKYVGEGGIHVAAQVRAHGLGLTIVSYQWVPSRL